MLSPQQKKALEDVRSDIGEVLITTVGYRWEDIKNERSEITYDTLLGWCNELNAVLGEVDK